ncbi:hypothetical protein EMIT0P253_20288 [Pseudomonas sp. IT-P253]
MSVRQLDYFETNLIFSDAISALGIANRAQSFRKPGDITMDVLLNYQRDLPSMFKR